MKMEVRYTGKPVKKLDKKVKKAAATQNMKLVGSGYNFLTNERDITFSDNE